MSDTENKFFGETSTENMKQIYAAGSADFYVEDRKQFLLGPGNTFHYLDDPKRIGFLFARYKFVSKMFAGMKNVLEIGCQEGIGTTIVAKAVEHIYAIDFFKNHIKHCVKEVAPRVPNIKFAGGDILDGAPVQGYDGAFCLDVFEHIAPESENVFFGSVVNSIHKDGVFIVGIPSLESQQYASKGSKEGHVNCKTGSQLKELCQKYFKNVFMFSMNDEVLHTGYFPMSQYLFALCVGTK